MSDISKITIETQKSEITEAGFADFDHEALAVMACREKRYKDSNTDIFLKIIGINVAMAVEAEKIHHYLVNNCLNFQEHKLAGRIYRQYLCAAQSGRSASTAETVTFVLAVGGCGILSGGITATELIEKFKVEAIIHTGIAGALNTNLNLFDFVLADSLGLARNFGLGYNVSYPYKEKYSGSEIYYSSKYLNTLIEEAYRELQSRRKQNYGKLHKGLIVSSDHFISENSQKEALIKEYPQVLACEMEGGATAKVCYCHGLPYAVIRCISDSGDSMEYSMFEKKASDLNCDLLLEILRKL